MPASWQIGGNGRKTMADGFPARPRPGAVMQPVGAHGIPQDGDQVIPQVLAVLLV